MARYRRAVAERAHPRWHFIGESLMRGVATASDVTKWSRAEAAAIGLLGLVSGVLLGVGLGIYHQGWPFVLLVALALLFVIFGMGAFQLWDESDRALAGSTERLDQEISTTRNFALRLRSELRSMKGYLDESVTEQTVTWGLDALPHATWQAGSSIEGRGLDPQTYERVALVYEAADVLVRAIDRANRRPPRFRTHETEIRQLSEEAGEAIAALGGYV